MGRYLNIGRVLTKNDREREREEKKYRYTCLCNYTTDNVYVVHYTYALNTYLLTKYTYMSILSVNLYTLSIGFHDFYL